MSSLPVMRTFLLYGQLLASAYEEVHCTYLVSPKHEFYKQGRLLVIILIVWETVEEIT